VLTDFKTILIPLIEILIGRLMDLGEIVTNKVMDCFASQHRMAIQIIFQITSKQPVLFQ